MADNARVTATRAAAEADAVPAQGRIKGAAFRGFVAWLEQERGPEALVRAVGLSWR
jgi:hypothetical protein